MKEKVAIVIPYYHSRLSEPEQISFRQCLKILHRHPIILVVPDTMDEKEYPDGHRFIYKRVPSKWMKSVASYNEMMLKADFYNMFRGYQYILIYQLDAFVFRDEILSFCELGYDYIGAPWPLGVRHFKSMEECIWYVGNGGLSLRNVEASVSMLEKNPADGWEKQEDVYWSTCNSEGFLVAPVDIARRFSIEVLVRKMFELNQKKLPFGCHAWNKLDFPFWKPYIEKEGYVFSQDILGEDDRQWEKMPTDILTIPAELVGKYFRKRVQGGNRRIYLWGSGKVGNEWAVLLRRAGFSVNCVDADRNKWGNCLWDICIEPPEVLEAVRPDSVVIITVKDHADEISDRLHQMGYQYGNNVFYYRELENNLQEMYDREMEKFKVSPG